MNNIEKAFETNSTAKGFADQYLTYLSKVLAQLDREEISKVIGTFQEARKNDSQILFIGNGGSAATASHFANDLGVGLRNWKKPFRALALTDNVAAITALANDHGYDHIFVRQLQIVMRPGDVVVAISASGNSKNIVDAVEYANTNGGKTIGFTGFTGGKLRSMAHQSIHVPTLAGEYGPVEDVHMILDHLISAFLMMVSRKEPT